MIEGYKDNYDRTKSKNTLRILEKLESGVCLSCGSSLAESRVGGGFCKDSCRRDFLRGISQDFNEYQEIEDTIHLWELGQNLETIDMMARYNLVKSRGEDTSNIKRRKINFEKLIEIRKIMSPIEIENVVKNLNNDQNLFE